MAEGRNGGICTVSEQLLRRDIPICSVSVPGTRLRHPRLTKNAHQNPKFPLTKFSCQVRTHNAHCQKGIA